MKKLPYGISNYEELITENYYYVDKTMYIEKLEELAEKRIMFLRPRKFGKTLFTSILENYYDIRKKDKFEKLCGETYIGKNPTNLRNSYHILRFNFSGIDTEDENSTMKGFRENVQTSIEAFIANYAIDFYINPEQTTEGMLNSLLEAFRVQKSGEKIYVIIDEYDHFANELLGFTKQELIKLMNFQQISKGKQGELFPIMTENYDGYKFNIFAEERIYNSNMCLYLLKDYIRLKRLPESLLDVNIAMNLKLFRTKSKLEVNRNYPDLLIVPRDQTKGYKSVMIEFKYLKKDEKHKLEEKQKEARAQIEWYSEFEEIREIENLNKYTVVVVNDEIFQEQVD